MGKTRERGAAKQAQPKPSYRHYDEWDWDFISNQA
uniref:Uncharacterized protein n=1 Tax=Cyanothece sp. (strain PCC 7425 / ATCC 29141) TaxID=395961 RepID=B8HJM7_CYAP4